MKSILQHQIWHLVFLILAIPVIYILTDGDFNYSVIFLGLNGSTWFWIAIAIPIIHQVYVLIIWRLELYHNTFTKRYGLTKAFYLYAVGFTILFVSRLIFITILGATDQNSLKIDPYLSYLIAAIIFPLVVYLGYSVKKYFTIERAYGIDHFDKNYNEPFEKNGIFKYTNNGMYIFGLMALYLPGLILLSESAIIVALFQHTYIWIHYYFTECPDMKKIYGKTPE